MKKLIILGLVGWAVWTAVSCGDQLDVTPPNAITNEQVAALLATADSAQRENILKGITGDLPMLISRVQVEGGNDWRNQFYVSLLNVRAIMGNDAVMATQARLDRTSPPYGKEQYTFVNQRTSTSSFNRNFWLAGWNMIHSANKALAILSDEVVGSAASLKRPQAWAHFVRAYGYSWLLDNYQDAYAVGGGSKPGMPVYLTFDPSQPYQARATLDECYAQINKDLDKAIANYTFGGTDGFTEAKNDLDAGSAYFLRARVALHTGDYAKAIEDLQKLVNHFGESFMTEEQYVAKQETVDDKIQYFAVNSGFMNLEQNPEVIYGLPFAEATRTGETSAASPGQALNCFATGTTNGSTFGNNILIDVRLYDKIADGDYRKNNFLIESITYEFADKNTQELLPYANLKFASTVGVTGGTNPGLANGTSIQNDWVIMRLSEVYLMLAEAYAKSGNESAAKNTLDKLIAARTGGTYATDTYPATAGKSTLEKIQLQWRIEMWGENGIEYYNNKRWNIPVDRSGSANHWFKEIVIPVSDLTMQLPEESVNYNGLLTQNP
ncbi:MAG: RagB/SusD family nutrient uptake outer membrane protein [Tannerella sp.]|jgi:tetratricopeptide (TPR) repeat protein|nr:RagB/SusD family nutrient uptake outer membrane protein [Tannerella sp.]